MDTVTYPDSEVESALRSSFVGLKIDLLARHPDMKEASMGQRVSFAPTFIFSEKGREIRRYTGWLPPRAYRAELLFVRAQAAWQRGDAVGSKALCDELLRDFADAPVVPEALYLQGMAGFIAGNKDFAAMRASWERCAREFPNSRFGIHASVIDDAPR